MKIPEGWPTEEMKQAGAMELWRRFDGAQQDAGKIFQAMLNAAPTPPAQEDEPYAYAYENIGLPEDLRKLYPFYNSIHRKQIKPVPSDWKEIRLYTRPQSDELRIVIEETIEVLERYHETGLVNRLLAALDP